MKKKVLRINREEGTWRELEVRLALDTDGRPSWLSICGSEGQIKLATDLREEAKEYWRSFFEETPGEAAGMLKRFKDSVICKIQEGLDLEEACAAVVLEVDGEFHGLDLEGDEDADGNYRTVESCGQIRETLAEWFPEVKPWFKWHLNDMNASCEHQEALGWGRGVDVALARKDCTPVQLEVLDSLLANRRARNIARHVGTALKELQASLQRVTRQNPHAIPHDLYNAIKQANGLAGESAGVRQDDGDIVATALGMCNTLEGLQQLIEKPQLVQRKLPQAFTSTSKAHIKGTLTRLRTPLIKAAELQYPPEEFRSEIFKDSLSAPCPECGYRYGTAWLKRELPAEVVEWFNGLDELACDDVSAETAEDY